MRFLKREWVRHANTGLWHLPAPNGFYYCGGLHGLQTKGIDAAKVTDCPPPPTCANCWAYALKHLRESLTEPRPHRIKGGKEV